MILLRFLALGALVAALAPTSATAQAWPRPAGDLFVGLDYLRVDTGDRWGVDGRERPFTPTGEARAFRDRTMALHGELGLTNAVTATLRLPYRRLRIQDSALSYRVEAQGDAELGVRVGVPELMGRAGVHGLVATLGARLPMGYTRNLRPSAGTGQVDLEAGLTYGYRFSPRPLVAEAGIGYRRRTPWYSLSQTDACTAVPSLGCFADRQSDFDDEFYAHAVLGGAVSELVEVRLVSDLLWSVRAPDQAFDASFPYPRRQRYLKVGGTFMARPFARLTLGIDVRATPWGRNALRTTDWLFRIGYDLSVW